MTDREKAIVMAYTGVAMFSGDKLSIFYNYVQEKLGRPIWTHELGDKAIQDEIEAATKQDFIDLCRDALEWPNY